MDQQTREFIDKRYGPFDPDNLVDQLINVLTDLVCKNRGAITTEIIEHYHMVYDYLVDLGWNGGLDIEAVLHYEQMPEHYQKRVPPRSF